MVTLKVMNFVDHYCFTVMLLTCNIQLPLKIAKFHLLHSIRANSVDYVLELWKF